MKTTSLLGWPRAICRARAKALLGLLTSASLLVTVLLMGSGQSATAADEWVPQGPAAGYVDQSGTGLVAADYSLAPGFLMLTTDGITVGASPASGNLQRVEVTFALQRLMDKGWNTVAKSSRDVLVRKNDKRATGSWTYTQWNPTTYEYRVITWVGWHDMRTNVRLAGGTYIYDDVNDSGCLTVLRSCTRTMNGGVVV